MNYKRGQRIMYLEGGIWHEGEYIRKCGAWHIVHGEDRVNHFAGHSCITNGMPLGAGPETLSKLQGEALEEFKAGMRAIRAQAKNRQIPADLEVTQEMIKYQEYLKDTHKDRPSAYTWEQIKTTLTETANDQ